MWSDFWDYFLQLLFLIALVVGCCLFVVLITTIIIFLAALFISTDAISQWFIGIVLVIVTLATIAFAMAWRDNH